MPSGIYKRTKEHRKNMSKIKKGQNKKPRKSKICKSQKCNNKFEIIITSTKKYCSLICANRYRKRKPHSEETKRKISKNRKGISKSKETKKKMSKAKMGHIVSETTRKKISKSSKGQTWSLSNKIKKRRSKTGKQRWQNPEYKEKQLKAIFAGLDLRPTKPERRLRRRINKLFSEEYKYIGNGTFWIGGKNPDFININRQKKIIELFGDYWHGEKRTGRTKRQEEQKRIKHFTKYGFETLIIWECELNNTHKLKRKLRIFNKK